MKEKILSMVTVVTILFSFTGCGDGGSSSNTTQTEKTTLTVDFKSAKSSFAQKVNVNDISEIAISITKGSSIYLDNAPMVKDAITNKWGIGLNLDNSLAPYNVLALAKGSGGKILYRTAVGSTIEDLTANVPVTLEEVVEEETSSTNLPSVKSITHSTSGNTVNIRFVINNAVSYELSSSTGGTFATPIGTLSTTNEAVLDAVYTKGASESLMSLKIKLINDGDSLIHSFNISEDLLTLNFPPLVTVNVEEQLIPSNTYKITATVTDEDSTSWTYAWGKIRGAKALASDVSNPNVLEIEALSNGEVYPLCFALSVTDDEGASSSLDYCVKNADNGYVGLKKTGQTKSYRGGGAEVIDDSVQDDGFYEKGLTPQYTRDSQRVTDHVTGLVWQDDADVATQYTWFNIQTHCEQKGNGWRVPTIEELNSIVDYGSSNFIDSEFQNHPLSFRYWSSSTNEFNNDYAWSVSLDNGNSDDQTKGHGNYVRCVRDGQ